MKVVSYSISTSNHNMDVTRVLHRAVVSYSISTSNHNAARYCPCAHQVVSYSISTSNHNKVVRNLDFSGLYLIPFLHQTTTKPYYYLFGLSCILFHFYIKPQLSVKCFILRCCCILFHFYIKPQLKHIHDVIANCCILFHFYIKPQRRMNCV